MKEPDGLGMFPRIGEPESSLVPGMAAPRPGAALGGLPGVALATIPDTSMSGPVSLQEPATWSYDFNPAGVSRATFSGEIVAGSGGGGAPLNSPAFTGNPTAPTPPAGDADTSIATSAFVSTAVAAVAAKATEGNLLRANGSFDVWQRGTPMNGILASTPQYTADRWYITNGANQALSVAAGNIPGAVGISRLAGRVRRVAGETGTGLMRWGYALEIDEAAALCDRFVALSFVVAGGVNWSPASGTLNYAVYLGTTLAAARRQGTPYTGETTPVIGSINLVPGANGVRVAVTSAAAVGPTVRQGEVQFWWTPTGTAGAADELYLDDVQLECVADANAIATLYQRATFAECYAACLPHYQKTFAYPTAPVQNAGLNTGEIRGFQEVGASLANAFYVNWFLQVPMRATPTVVTFNPAVANAQIRNTTTNADYTVTSTLVGEKVVTVLGTSPAGSALTDKGAVHMTADASI